MYLSNIITMMVALTQFSSILAAPGEYPLVPEKVVLQLKIDSG